MNPDVAQLLASLQAQHAALYAKMGTVTDPKIGQAILLEAQEVLHRINIAQNLTMIAVAPDVTAAVALVGVADQELSKDLQSIVNAAKIVDSMTKYLGYVDKALDIMKKVVAL